MIFLQGVGADGFDLLELSREFSKAVPNAIFLSPHAPFPYDEFSAGRQWFSLRDRSEEKLYQGIKIALPILKAYIDDNLAKYKLEYKDLVLIGFSQGTMMALQMAFRLPSSCTAVIGFSGALINPTALHNELKSTPAVFLGHGDDDQVVPISQHYVSVKHLKKIQPSLEEHIAKGSTHTISLKSLNLAIDFLKKQG